MIDDLRLIQNRRDYEKLLFFRAMLFRYEENQAVFYDAKELEKIKNNFDFFYTLLSDSKLGYINKGTFINLLQIKFQLCQSDKEKAAAIQELIPNEIPENELIQELFKRRMNKLYFTVNENYLGSSSQSVVLPDQLHYDMINFDYKIIHWWKNDECADNLAFYQYSLYSFLLFQNEYAPMMQEKYPNELMNRILNSSLIDDYIEQQYSVKSFIKQIQDRNNQFN